MFFMDKFVLTVLFIIVLHLVNSSDLPEKKEFQIEEQTDNLILVQFIFRHGDRSPSWLYKNNPYHPSDFPEGVGELSNRGRIRMNQFGQVLRSRYRPFIGKFW